MKLGQAFVVTDIPGYSAVALACLGPKDPGYDELEALDVTKVTYLHVYSTIYFI